MRLGVTDLVRRRGAVNAVMAFGEAHPDDADRVVRSGWNFRARIVRTRVPEELRVVVEPGIVLNGGDLPHADGQRIVFAAHGGRVLGDDCAVSIKGGKSEERGVGKE